MSTSVVSVVPTLVRAAAVSSCNCSDGTAASSWTVITYETRSLLRSSNEASRFRSYFSVGVVDLELCDLSGAISKALSMVPFACSSRR